MNGYEATRAIRALGREDLSDLPIIALSANARQEDKRASIESGMNDHFSKPFDTNALISKINVYAAKYRAERE
jgi:CheY-like chemotaxis protein